MKRHLLLSGGPNHDFAETTEVLIGLAADCGLETTVVDEPAALFSALGGSATADPAAWALVTVNALRWSMTQDRYADLRASFEFEVAADDLRRLRHFVAEGGGLLALHTAVICFDGHPMWHDLLGGTWNWNRSTHEPEQRAVVEPTPASLAHPGDFASAGFAVVDEVYRDLDLDNDVAALFTSQDRQGTHPVAWARTIERGRVFVDTLGHSAQSLRDPGHGDLIRSAWRWMLAGDDNSGGHHDG